MPDVTAAGFVSPDPQSYNYALVGTAAGTTVIQASPCFFYGVSIPTRIASGTLTIFDSGTGTATPLGTIVLGTQTFSDPPPTYEFHAAMKNGLTITNSASLGATILYR